MSETASRPGCHAVACQLERSVRRHFAASDLAFASEIPSKQKAHANAVHFSESNLCVFALDLAAEHSYPAVSVLASVVEVGNAIDGAKVADERD
jgi:hypothetical protein